MLQGLAADALPACHDATITDFLLQYEFITLTRGVLGLTRLSASNGVHTVGAMTVIQSRILRSEI